MLSAGRGELFRAIEIVGGLSILCGVAAWILAHLRTLVSGKDMDIERWMANSAGGGGAIGILLAILDFLL